MYKLIATIAWPTQDGNRSIGTAFAVEFKTEAAAVTARDWYHNHDCSAEVVVDIGGSDQSGDFVEGRSMHPIAVLCRVLNRRPGRKG